MRIDERIEGLEKKLSLAINCLKGINALNIPSDNMEMAIQYGIIQQNCRQTLDEIDEIDKKSEEKAKYDPDNLSDDDFKNIIRKAVSRLKLQERNADIYIRRLYGERFKDIAEVHGISESVASRVFRSLSWNVGCVIADEYGWDFWKKCIRKRICELKQEK